MQKNDILKVLLTEVREKEYMENLRKSLQDLPAGVWVLLCLCPKLGNFSDETAPLFAFNSESVPMEIIMDWARAFSDFKLMLPELKVKYLLVTGSEEELENQLDIFDKGTIENPELQIVLQRYKTAVEAAA